MAFGISPDRLALSPAEKLANTESRARRRDEMSIKRKQLALQEKQSRSSSAAFANSVIQRATEANAKRRAVKDKSYTDIANKIFDSKQKEKETTFKYQEKQEDRRYKEGIDRQKEESDREKEANKLASEREKDDRQFKLDMEKERLKSDLESEKDSFERQWDREDKEAEHQRKIELEEMKMSNKKPAEILKEQEYELNMSEALADIDKGFYIDEDLKGTYNEVGDPVNPQRNLDSAEAVANYLIRIKGLDINDPRIKSALQAKAGGYKTRFQGTNRLGGSMIKVDPVTGSRYQFDPTLFGGRGGMVKADAVRIPLRR